MEQAYGPDVMMAKTTLCIGLKVPQSVPAEETFFYPQYYFHGVTESAEACATRWKADFRESLIRWDIKFSNHRYLTQLNDHGDMIASLIRGSHPRGPLTKAGFYPCFRCASQIMRLVIISRTQRKPMENAKSADDTFRVEWNKPHACVNFGKIIVAKITL